MPELPEVEMVRRFVEERCQGRTISRLKVIDEGILDGIGKEALVRSVQGRRIVAVKRHGKQLFLELSDGVLTVHLGMTGDLLMLNRKERTPSHVRVLIILEDGTRLAYDDPRKFGAIGIASSANEFVTERRLGPDALQISSKEFVERAHSSRRAIKSVLLDQHVLAGVGNLYADEALYQAKVHPLTPANELSNPILKKIWARTRQVLRISINVSTDFSKLPGGFLLRSRVAGGPCSLGHGRLQAIKVGGRTTIFCPNCQRII
jgi:formamidopyrimidine-DNA glycosylase